MPITDRNLKPGMKLTAKYHKQDYTCEVLEGEGGKLKYKLEDGREFKSPSGAGMTITSHACDGWTFWSVETAEAAPATETAQAEEPEQTQAGTTLAAETPESGAPEPTSEDDAAASQEYAPTEPAAEEPGPAKKRIIRIPNQKGAPEGQTRWYCHDCGKSFFTPSGETPETCPQGHKA